MLKKEDIEQFYKDVSALDLKFPVAAIADATGQSKSNVSKYLSRKLEPSETFLNAFYDKFPKNGKIVSRETNTPVRPQEAQQAPDSEFMRKYIDMLERENSRLASQSETNLKILEELKGIVSQNFALLSSLRYAAALILLNQRKGLIRDLSRKEVSDLVAIAGSLDKVVADALNLSPKMDKIPENIR